MSENQRETHPQRMPMPKEPCKVNHVIYLFMQRILQWQTHTLFVYAMMQMRVFTNFFLGSLEAEVRIKIYKQ
jgi:hypothetical protein